MRPSQRAFLSGLIDYAGLFPPAALDLRPAMFTYARDRTGPDAWMLNRFILPVSRLIELQPFLNSLDVNAPLGLSVLGYAPASSSPEPWANRAMRTLVDAHRFEQRSGGRIRCDRFEMRLPVELASDADALALTLGDLDGVFRAQGRGASGIALEVPLLEAPATVAPTAQAIAVANGRAARDAFVLKLRCGGVTADLFPSVEMLASALVEPIRAEVPFKATAGLHHPVRQYRDEVEAEMHGFVNVFGGAILARRHGLDADALADILSDTDPNHFELGETLSWKHLSATSPDIAEARERFALSYGSCSFDEPRDDLRQLGWL
ncbi:MAG: hypothetical protein Rubg2KO_02880 [Rubricoccaceae bacterium]